MADGCLSPAADIDLTMVGSPRALRATNVVSDDAGNGFEKRVDGVYVPVRKRVAFFPGSPFDTQEVLYRVDDTHVWGFVYLSSSSFGYKWVFTGGAAVYVERNQFGSYTPGGSNDWQTLSGSDVAGPDYLAPFTGVYQVRFGARIDSNADASMAQVGLSINGADPVDDATASNANSHFVSAARDYEAIIGVGQRFRLMYRAAAAGGTVQFSHRWMSILPIRAQ